MKISLGNKYGKETGRIKKRYNQNVQEYWI